MNELYVRVAPKSGNTQFYRCAMLFTLVWSLVIVDDATKHRLLAEQMLEVSETKPEGYVEPDEVKVAEMATTIGEVAANLNAALTGTVIAPPAITDANLAQVESEMANEAETLASAPEADLINMAETAAENYAAGESTAAADAIAEQADSEPATPEPAAPAPAPATEAAPAPAPKVKPATTKKGNK